MKQLARRVALAALVGGLPVAALLAQPAERPAPETGAGESPIVVTGTRLDPQEARARAIALVRETGVAAGERPVARWLDPVCIDVIGISERHAGIVKARLQRIAAAAGVPVAGGNCENNVAVVFTDDASHVVREVERRSPRRLEEVRGDTRQRLLEGNAPIRWWYSTQPRSRHSTRQSTNSPGFTGGEGPSAQGVASTTSAGSVLPDNIPNLYHYNSSMISTQAVRALISSSVIVDVDMMHLPLDTVAAYIAMVAFAEIRENDFSSPGSILGLFAQGEAAPRGLTEWDMAFLRVLYRLPLDRAARQHRGLLVRDILAEVEQGS